MKSTISAKKSKAVIGGCTLWARKTIDSAIFAKKPDKWFKIWFYIVSRVNHADNPQFKRGQGHLSYESIMLACGATKSQVDHSIRWFKNCQMCATRKATRGFIITVCNYDFYQNLQSYKSDSSGDSKATQKRHYKQECNNGDEIKKESHLQIFNHWNKYKGKSVSKQRGGENTKITWHSHKLRPDGSISPEIENAVSQTLKGKHSVGDVCGAVDNYARVLLSSDYWWTHVWALPTFLTVKYERRKDADHKWWQFLPDNFIEEHYLTESAKRKRATKVRGPSVYELAKEESKRTKQDEQKQTA